MSVPCGLCSASPPGADPGKAGDVGRVLRVACCVLSECACVRTALGVGPSELSCMQSLLKLAGSQTDPVLNRMVVQNVLDLPSHGRGSAGLQVGVTVQVSRDLIPSTPTQ